jgi:hypothetical protein
MLLVVMLCLTHKIPDGLIVQFDIERALALYGIREDQFVETNERIKLAVGPVSIRSMLR